MNGGSQVTPGQVLQDSAQIVSHLLARATRDQGLERKLEAVNGRPVEVYLVQPDVIAAASRRSAAGCVFSEPSRYLLFCDEGGAPGMPQSFTLQQRRRYVVLEEYAHALHGDVYTDDPARMLVRTRTEWDVAEACARGYAAERFATELAAGGQRKLATFVLSLKAQNSWVFPSDSAYAQRYPSLGNHRTTW